MDENNEIFQRIARGLVLLVRIFLGSEPQRRDGRRGRAIGSAYSPTHIRLRHSTFPCSSLRPESLRSPNRTVAAASRGASRLCISRAPVFIGSLRFPSPGWKEPPPPPPGGTMQSAVVALRQASPALSHASGFPVSDGLLPRELRFFPETFC